MGPSGMSARSAPESRATSLLHIGAVEGASSMSDWQHGHQELKYTLRPWSAQPVNPHQRDMRAVFAAMNSAYL